MPIRDPCAGVTTDVTSQCAGMPVLASIGFQALVTWVWSNSPGAASAAHSVAPPAARAGVPSPSASAALAHAILDIPVLPVLPAFLANRRAARQ